MSKPAHVLVPSATARGIVNMTALAVIQSSVVGRRSSEGGPPTTDDRRPNQA